VSLVPTHALAWHKPQRTVEEPFLIVHSTLNNRTCPKLVHAPSVKSPIANMLPLLNRMPLYVSIYGPGHKPWQSRCEAGKLEKETDNTLQASLMLTHAA
jgi:hypothetical protein